MNLYELTVVFPGEMTAAKKKAAQEKVEKLVGINEGKVKKTNDWGKIDLIYTIDKQNSGNFVLYDLELEPAAAKNIGDKLRLEEDVIRYLLVKKEKEIKKKK